MSRRVGGKPHTLERGSREPVSLTDGRERRRTLGDRPGGKSRMKLHFQAWVTRKMVTAVTEIRHTYGEV